MNENKRRYLLLGKSRQKASILCALTLIILASWTVPAQQLPVKMKLLVITGLATDPSYVGITAFLDFVGVPYTSLIAANQALTPAFLVDAAGGKFQGVILATDSLPVNGTSAFDAAEWQALWNYEAQYKVRQVTYFTYPNAQFGYVGTPTSSSTDTAPLITTLTNAGQQVFSYLKPNIQIPIRLAWTYLAKTDPLDLTTTVLLKDGSGNAIVSVHNYSDGRENLAVTCDNWRYLLHSQLLAYGIIDWVTRGIHLGERTVYLTPQIDDIFLDNELYSAAAKGADPSLLYRLNDVDMLAVENWQNSVKARRDPSFENFVLTMVYNGGGVLGSTDKLAAYFSLRQILYQWVNHTYNHPNLDTIKYAAALQDFRLNHYFALAFPLIYYRVESMVTGAITGLTNEEAMWAIADFGINYIVSDTSQVGQNNPRPNIGIYNALEPSVLEVPRHPTNIYTTGSTPAQETDHYNLINSAYWGRNLSYEEILGHESDQILAYMACYDMDPLMFHQSNLRAYDGQRSVLGDLMNAVILKYSAAINLPVLSPNLHALGERMAQHMARMNAGVVAQWKPGIGIRLTASEDAVVPVSGIPVGALAGVDTYRAGTYRLYGGKATSWVQVNAGQAILVPLTGGETGTAPPEPPPVVPITVGYFPTAAAITVGTLSGGGISSFPIVDENTYNVTSSSTRITDWNVTTKMVGLQRDAIVRLTLTYKGYYSRSNTLQDVFLYNYTNNSWVKLDSRAIGNVEDVTVMIQVNSNPQRFISSTGDMRARVRGENSKGSFDCYANFLSWTLNSGSSTTNTPPVAQNDSLTTDKNKVLTFSAATLLANDTDPNGDPLAVTSVTALGSTRGSIASTGDGIYSYTPPANFVGTDSFQYSISDGRGGTATATVQVMVKDTTTPPPTLPTTIYYPSAVTVVSGTYDWGTLTSFKKADKDTYDVLSKAITGGYETDWNVSATMKVGTPAQATQLTVKYLGQYSQPEVTQEAFLWNYSSTPAGWERINAQSVGNTDDVTVSVTISSNPQRYISAGGEMKVRIRGFRPTKSFYCWANALTWEVR